MRYTNIWLYIQLEARYEYSVSKSEKVYISER